MNCRMCHREVEKLICCHIYPDAFTREMRREGGVLVHASNGNSGPRAGIANKGMFDRNIVCADCEAMFKAADDYAIEFRRHVLALTLPSYTPWGEGSLRVFYPSQPELLHRFAMQTWFRCYLSDLHEAVADQAIADEIRPCLLSGESTIRAGRQVTYVFDRSDLGRLALGPILHQGIEFPMYELAMPNMVILIAATPAGLPPGFSAISLRPGNEVAVWRTRKWQRIRLQHLDHVLGPSADRIDRMFGSAKR